MRILLKLIYQHHYFLESDHLLNENCPPSLILTNSAVQPLTYQIALKVMCTGSVVIPLSNHTPHDFVLTMQLHLGKQICHRSRLFEEFCLEKDFDQRIESWSLGRILGISVLKLDRKIDAKMQKFYVNFPESCILLDYFDSADSKNTIKNTLAAAKSTLNSRIKLFPITEFFE